MSRLPRGAVAWAFYDFANTIFSMNVLTMYLLKWVSVDQGQPDLWYSVAFSLSMILVAVTLPVLGTLADSSPRGRLSYLLAFTVAAILGTALIGVAARGAPGPSTALAALAAFVVANYAFQGSLVFYNALLPLVSTPATLGRISGFGVAMGYVGSIAGLLMVAPFVEGKAGPISLTIPGIEPGGRAAAFLPTAFFYALFSIPLFLRIKIDAGARPIDTRPVGVRLRAAINEVRAGLRDVGNYPGVRRFLVANWLFVNCVHTILIVMGKYALEVVGMPDSTQIILFILATTGAVAGGLIAGREADRHGPKTVLVAVLLGWIACLLIVALIPGKLIIWLSGVAIGLCLGGTWTTARALLARLTPPDELGRFFGLYALSDKAGAVLGSLTWGIVVGIGAPLGPWRYRLAVLV
ncbi:MAG TPA: MFS transporter, partial [Candidatus Eisenbacteria bacterium]